MTNDPAPVVRLLPESASTFADRLDWLMWFLTGTSTLLTLVVFVAVVYFGLKYRRRDEAEVPRERPAGMRTEIAASAFLFAIFMVMFAWGAWLFVESRRPPHDALTIDVVGKQWM